MRPSRDSAQVTPDQLKVNPIQAKRLGALTKQSARELEGLKHADLSDRLRWIIDPRHLFFQKICGKVVKKDPVTGVEYPVPHATVHVLDTDCGLVAYYPSGSQYVWYYPLFCRRETLATVKTDECGEFCVWVPRWDIDWILRWRKQWVCFPFERPRIADLLEDIPVLVEDFPPRPGPEPDPFVNPARALARVGRLRDSQLADAIGPQRAGRIGAVAAWAATGASTAEASAALSDHLELQPPLPAEFRQVEVESSSDERRGERHTMDLVRSTLAQRLGVDVARLKDFDLRHPIGPFKRCFSYYVPEWSLVVDVPDISFRVTQDVDGDGDEETIYSEGLFDVRWDAENVPPVKLVASGLARESRICGEDPPVACGNVPDIQFAGMMPLTPPPDVYIGSTSGYGLRPNRPRPLPPPMDPQETATAPFCDNVNLFGCLIRAGATKYRLVYRYSDDGGSTFSPEVPFTGAEWWWHPVGGPPVLATPDGDGWYDLPPAGLAGPEVNFLFPFNTPAHANGLYEIRLQMGTGGSSVTASSAPVRLRTDNSYPEFTRTIQWRRVGTSGWTPLELPCPVVTRGTTPQDVEFDVRWEVSATHYRNAGIGAGDCGAGGFNPPVVQAGSTASGGTSDWHQGPLDNAVVFHVRYVLPGSVAQGTYSFGMTAHSRAFNPAGLDANYQALDWFYDSPNGGRYVTPALYFSVINS